MIDIITGELSSSQSLVFLLQSSQLLTLTWFNLYPPLHFFYPIFKLHFFSALSSKTYKILHQSKKNNLE